MTLGKACSRLNVSNKDTNGNNLAMQNIQRHKVKKPALGNAALPLVEY